MDLVEILAVAGTVFAVVFSWSSFLLSLKEREEEEHLSEELERRILELMGRFKYVSSVRLKMLDKKIEEIRSVMKEANDVYSSLMVKLTDIAKMKEDLPEVVGNIPEIQEDRREEGKDEEKVEEVSDEIEMEDEMNLEKRIITMYDEGFSDVEIARKLGIGIGEVRLIISLFGRE